MEEEKIAVGLWLFGKLSDRFTTYHPSKTLEQKMEQASQIKDIQGLEIMYPVDFKDEQLDELKSLLKEGNLKVASIIVDHFCDPKWLQGSFASTEKKIREDAVNLTKKAMDVSRELKCPQVNLWLGQDGYDYPLQTDYKVCWEWLVEGIRECAEYQPEIRIAIEYKMKEPRTHIFIATVGKALLLATSIGLKNVGITLDIGHALFCGENPSESLILIDKWGKLFHLHLNDNYREWDHDMIVGSVNLWEYLELFFWLEQVNYQGWLSLDVYPYREDVAEACRQSIQNIKTIRGLVDKLGMERLKEVIEGRDSTKIATLLRDIFS
jgi:xylose isomerase